MRAGVEGRAVGLGNYNLQLIRSMCPVGVRKSVEWGGRIAALLSGVSFCGQLHHNCTSETPYNVDTKPRLVPIVKVLAVQRPILPRHPTTAKPPCNVLSIVPLVQFCIISGILLKGSLLSTPALPTPPCKRQHSTPNDHARRRLLPACPSALSTCHTAG